MLGQQILLADSSMEFSCWKLESEQFRDGKEALNNRFSPLGRTDEPLASDTSKVSGRSYVSKV